VRLPNTIVSLVLRSPLHRLLSRSVALVRYTGRTSGREITTPASYAAHGENVVILVGRPDTKTWWRNFREGRDLELLIGRRWRPMTGRAVAGVSEPDALAPLLEIYRRRFPTAARTRTVPSTGDESPEQAVVVWCRPRPETSAAS
jgi:hypothetical protein